MDPDTLKCWVADCAPAPRVLRRQASGASSQIETAKNVLFAVEVDWPEPPGQPQLVNAADMTRLRSVLRDPSAAAAAATAAQPQRDDSRCQVCGVAGGATMLLCDAMLSPTPQLLLLLGWEGLLCPSPPCSTSPT